MQLCRWRFSRYTNKTHHISDPPSLGSFQDLYSTQRIICKSVFQLWKCHLNDAQISSIIQDPMNTNHVADFFFFSFFISFFVLFLISSPINHSVEPSNLSGELLEVVQLSVLEPLFFYLIGQNQPAAPLSHTEICALIYLTLSDCRL